MRILHTVEFYWPSVGGAQEVVRQISERLASRGHEVTVATTRIPERRLPCVEGVRIREFGIQGNAVRGMEGPVAEYHSFLFTTKFDVMMNYAGQQWTADAAFGVLDRLPYPKVLAPCGFSGLYQSVYRDYFARLPEVLKRYDKLIFHSSTYRDYQFANDHGFANSIVIPNGADEREFGAVREDFRAKYGISPGEKLVISVGTHTGLKGHDTAIEAFRRARTGPSVLVVVGNVMGTGGCLSDCRRRAQHVRLRTLGRKRVLLLDPGRSDVIAAYQAADLLLCTSNLECSPIVLFEAMASRTPFISTACGNAAEIATVSGGGIVTETLSRSDGTVVGDPSKIAKQIEELLADDEKRSHLAAAGHHSLRANFTWDNITAQYEKVYESLIGA